jgi:catechol 2,3-dioxygenase-like lactoylglutathione lyase family enzyme
METSSNIRLAVPFFMVMNMEASLQFYVNKLGFTLANQWTPRGKIEWCLLQRDGVWLMLQEPRNKEQFNGTEKGKGISICFQCKDALALYHEFSSHNIEIKEPFVGNNMWVVCFTDPDGYRLDFESPTDVPEETMYSDWVKATKENSGQSNA